MHGLTNLTGSAREIAETLRQELRRLETARRPVGEAVPTGGCAALGRLLPGGAFARGTLVEWLADGDAGGAGTLALLSAQSALTTGGVLVVFDRSRSGLPGEASLGSERHGGRSLQREGRSPQREGQSLPNTQFYPPGAAALGLDLEHLIVVRPGTERDELWALYQTFRSPGVAAVWAALEKIEWRWFRRLQLAAESGGAVGHLLRPANVRGRPTWSQVQLLVETCPGVGAGGRRLRVELLRSRMGATAGTGEGKTGGVVELELDNTTRTLREANPTYETPAFALAAELDRPAKKRRGNKRLAS